VGTVEPDITISNIRSDVGLGIRVNLPFFQGIPVSVDFAYPTTKADGDETQLISISLSTGF
jgi:outer membrane protein assembly factor BamA